MQSEIFLSTIMDFNKTQNGLLLNNYRWDIKTLGFAFDEKEAKARRKKVQQEADFYGAMDGAGKFVKGDSIAGIIITCVNLIGGIILIIAFVKNMILNTKSNVMIITKFFVSIIKLQKHFIGK